MNNKKIIFTSSWDDGYKLDFRIAELLNKYACKGTFYIAQKHGRGALSMKEIIDLTKYHEIGAHTLNHVELDKVDLKIAKDEICGSKKYLEDVIGKEVPMFCYPKGRYNENIEKIVKECNFIGARSTEKFCYLKPRNYFEFGVTLQVYPFPLRKKNSSQYLLNWNLFDSIKGSYKKIRELNLPWNSYLGWQFLARNFFNLARESGEIFHLYGHSWEVERYGMWKELEKLLKYISRRKDVLYLNNSETLEYFAS